VCVYVFVCARAPSTVDLVNRVHLARCQSICSRLSALPIRDEDDVLRVCVCIRVCACAKYCGLGEQSAFSQVSVDLLKTVGAAHS